jgi:hypothetical protein
MFQRFRLKFAVDWHDTTTTRPSRQSNDPVFDIIGAKHAQNIAFAIACKRSKLKYFKLSDVLFSQY